MGVGYRIVRFLSQAALKIFFSNVEVIGIDNIPRDAPTIVVGNHKNQFVDAMVVVAFVRRTVSFLVAEKSMHRPIIGDLARILSSIPVIRPQDKARAGRGLLVAFDAATNTLSGDVETRFQTDVVVGELIFVKGHPHVAPLSVIRIVSDSEIVVSAPVKPEDEADGSGGSPTTLVFDSPASYKVFPKVDQNQVYSRVHDALCNNQAIGIFPEGGSSDRTELLPLKAGVSVMALGAADRGADVGVVPFGINYYNADKWRSRVVIDVGKPIPVPPDVLALYREGKRRDAYSTYLKLVETGLRKVTVTAPDLKSMHILRTMRRVFQGPNRLSPHELMELNRNFSALFTHFREDERFLKLVDAVDVYLGRVKRAGLTDATVAVFPSDLGSLRSSANAFLLICVNLLVVVVGGVLGFVGGVAIYPALLRVSFVSQREVKKALAGSTVKVEGKDVAASQKIIGAFIWIPLTVVFYTVLAGVLTGTLWPKSLPQGVDPTSPEAWLFANAVWLIPLAVFVLLLPLARLAIVFHSAAFVALNHSLPRHFRVFTAFGRRNTSLAGKLRNERKDLGILIQDFVEEFAVPAIPSWRTNPVIPRSLVLDTRRPSDRKRDVDGLKLTIFSTGVAPEVQVPRERAPTFGSPLDVQEHQRRTRNSIKSADVEVLRAAMVADAKE